MKVMIPLSQEKLGGPFVEGEARVLGRKGRAAILEFVDVPAGVTWFGDFEMMYAQGQHDGETFKVLRKATGEEIKRFRVAVWVQGDDVPECCGKAMSFVGQIDDDAICEERPAGAKMWWHDAASFYVFTCGECLGVKAVGQQY